MDTGVENPNATIGSSDDAVMDEIIRSALRMIASAYSGHNRPIVDIRPVASGYRVFIENDEGEVTVWIDRVNDGKGTPVYVADVEGPFQIRHTVFANEPTLAITRAVFAARPHVNALRPQHAWIAPQTPAYVAWLQESPQLIGVATTLSAAMRHARAFDETDKVLYALMPFSDFVEVAGGYGYEIAAAIEAFVRYGAATLHVDREVAARLEKAAAATQ